MKWMGDGFGGKDTHNVFCSVATAAKLTNCPVWLTPNRDMDMSTGRHTLLAKYKSGALVVEKDGSVTFHALDVKLCNNGGGKFDLPGPVLDRALFGVENCYHGPGTPCCDGALNIILSRQRT